MAMGYVTRKYANNCSQVFSWTWLFNHGHGVTRSPRRPGLQPAFLAPGRHRHAGLDPLDEERVTKLVCSKFEQDY